MLLVIFLKNTSELKPFLHIIILTQQAFTCLKSTIDTLERGVKHVQ